MSNDLTTRSDTEIATMERLWLLNTENGRVLPWTPYLAVMPKMVDCTAEGEKISASSVPGDHEWIKLTTTALRDQLISAGADENTLARTKQQLIDDAASKFRALEHEPDPDSATSNNKSRKKRMVEKVWRVSWVLMAVCLLGLVGLVVYDIIARVMT